MTTVTPALPHMNAQRVKVLISKHTVTYFSMPASIFVSSLDITCLFSSTHWAATDGLLHVQREMYSNEGCQTQPAGIAMWLCNSLYVRSNDFHEKLLNQVHVDIDITNHYTEVSNWSSFGVGWIHKQYTNYCKTGNFRINIHVHCSLLEIGMCRVS